MKQVLFGFGLILSMTTNGQITLTQSDFATGGDTVRMSIANDNGYDFTSTGPAYTWNFSMLAPNSQVLKNFQALNAAPFFVQFIFGTFAPANYQASYFNESTDLPLAQITSFLPITIQNIFQYTKRSMAAVNSVGYSMNVSFNGNTNDLPIKSDTIETRYSLPLTFGATNFSRGYTTVDFNPIYDAQWNQHRTRLTTVDGYGSITTPYGTYDVLRVRHDIDEVDSLYTVLPFFGGTWIPLDIPVSHEYEWWAKNQKEPILRFRTNEIAGNEVVTAIEYRDIYRGLDAGLDELSNALMLYPNPVSNELTIQTEVPCNAVDILSLDGKLIEHIEMMGTKSYTYNPSSLAPGTYQIKVHYDSKVLQRLFVKQ